MRRVVTAKFETHAALREHLLSTGERPLVERAPGDTFWGAGPDGMGENRLGRLLEDLRARFRAKAAPTKGRDQAGTCNPQLAASGRGRLGQAGRRERPVRPVGGRRD